MNTVEGLALEVRALRQAFDVEGASLCLRVEQLERDCAAGKARCAQLERELNDLRAVIRSIRGEVASQVEWGDDVFTVMQGGAAALASLPPAPASDDPACFQQWVIASLNTLIGVGAGYQSLSPSLPLEGDDSLVVR